MTLPYSARFSRRSSGRPGSRGAMSSSVASAEISAVVGAASGRGMPGGGIAPARSLCSTSSHTGAWSRTEPRATTSRARPPVFVRSLWHVTQYLRDHPVTIDLSEARCARQRAPLRESGPAEPSCGGASRAAASGLTSQTRAAARQATMAGNGDCRRGASEFQLARLGVDLAPQSRPARSSPRPRRRTALVGRYWTMRSASPSGMSSSFARSVSAARLI